VPRGGPLTALRHPALLTFDCYGTLIDWHGGLCTVLADLGVPPADRDRLAARYVEVEARIEAGDYLPYREVMARGLERVMAEAGMPHPAGRREALAAALPGWEPFPETVGVLRALGGSFPLAILSNIDDDLLEGSVRRIGVPFAHRVTAQQVRSYKPAPGHFRSILERTGHEAQAVLHVGASVHHDMTPARALGIPHVWINRRAERRPDWLAPDRVLLDLRRLADRLLAPGSL